MPAPIRMEDGPLSFPQLGNRRIQYGIHQPGAGRCPERPGYRHAVKTVNVRREIYFSRRKTELSHICQPFFVGLFRMEIPVNKIGCRRADLTRIGVVVPASDISDGVELPVAIAAIHSRKGLPDFCHRLWYLSGLFNTIF